MKTSVAMCTYNGELFLKEQINSILNQTLCVDEIIICDDGSTDSTISIVEDYVLKNPNLIKIYRNNVNLRSVKNFEKAISLCTGDIIFLADQDDIWVKNKVEKYIQYFTAHPSISVIASNGYCIDDQGTEHVKYSIWDVPQFLNENGLPFDYYKIIALLSNIATGATMAFRKEIISDLLPFPEIKDLHHDEWIALVGAKNNNFALLNEKLFYYRIHNSQQVGGVFFDKNEKNRTKYIHIFNLNNDLYTFSEIKSKVKRLIIAYTKNKLLSEVKVQFRSEFVENMLLIKAEITKMNTHFENDYPIKSMLLKISDKLLNKRKLPF